MRETPVQSYCEVRNGTGWDTDRATHNPKVVGSNPTPATNISAGQAPLLGVGPSAARGIFYRIFYRTFRHAPSFSGTRRHCPPETG